MTYHDNEDSDEDCNEIGKERKGMLDIVQIPKVSLLNYVLGIHYHVPHKD